MGRFKTLSVWDCHWWDSLENKLQKVLLYKSAHLSAHHTNGQVAASCCNQCHPTLQSNITTKTQVHNDASRKQWYTHCQSQQSWTDFSLAGFSCQDCSGCWLQRPDRIDQISWQEKSIEIGIEIFLFHTFFAWCVSGRSSISKKVNWELVVRTDL